MQEFNYAAPAGSDFVQLFELGGLIVQARCNAGPALEVTARTLAGNSDIVSTVGRRLSDSDPDFDGGEQYTVINDPTQDDVAAASVSYAGADARPVTIQGVAIQEPTPWATAASTTAASRGRGRRLDLDDHRQDHRPAAQAVVDELRHVVVQVVLEQVDLADLLLGRAG